MTGAEARRREQRDLWDAEAARFDDEPDHGLRDPATRAAWHSLLGRHLPDPPCDVADLGCGTGSLAVLLAEQGHRVRGTDLSPRMVALARAKAAAHGVADLVTVAEGDAGDAGDPDHRPSGSDAVVCRHVLWALPDPGDALARWASLLRPGGVLVLVEGHWHTGGGLRAEETEALVRGVPGLVDVAVEHLPDPALWGGPLRDERYLLRATAG